MPGTEGFLELAGIAGVFVGFGALIAVRGGGASDPVEVAYMRGVVSMGLLTIVATLAPVALGRYDLAEHGVWALSSVVLVAGLAAMVALNVRTPEYRVTPFERRLVLAGGIAAVAIIFLAAVLAPVVILLGVAPDVEAALYFSAVVLILLLDAFWLLQLVFRGRQPASA